MFKLAVTNGLRLVVKAQSFFSSVGIGSKGAGSCHGMPALRISFARVFWPPCAAVPQRRLAVGTYRQFPAFRYPFATALDSDVKVTWFFSEALS